MKTLLITLATVLTLGCGAGTDGQPAAPPTTPARPLAPLPLPEPEPMNPAEAGKVAPGALVVDGLPPGTPYEWTTDEHSGWVFPASGRTAADGWTVATWIPGFPGPGRLVLALLEPGGGRSIEFDTVSVAPPRPPWSAASVSYKTVEATGFSIDMTPLAEPEGTFYAAINVGSFVGYAGLQRGGTLADRQMLFSFWDAPESEAAVVEMGEGTDCLRFDHEQSGVKCELEYPWSAGQTYRFELTRETEGRANLFTLRVTDLDAGGDGRFIATLRTFRGHFIDYFTSFVEDFARDQPTCLDQPLRRAAFRRARVRDVGRRWSPVRDGELFLSLEDAANPGTPACANADVREHAAGAELVIGGTAVRDPNASLRFRVPE